MNDIHFYSPTSHNTLNYHAELEASDTSDSDTIDSEYPHSQTSSVLTQSEFLEEAESDEHSLDNPWKFIHVSFIPQEVRNVVEQAGIPAPQIVITDTDEDLASGMCLQREIICDLCGEPINVTAWSNYAFRQHRDSKRCKKTRLRTEKMKEDVHASVQLRSLSRSPTPQPMSPLPSSQPTHTPGSSDRRVVSEGSIASHSSAASLMVMAPYTRSHSAPPLLPDPQIYLPREDYQSVILHGQENIHLPSLCEGTKLEWTAGSIYRTFPWQILEDQTLGFYVCGFQNRGQDIWIKSDACYVLADPDNESCTRCRQLPNLRIIENLRTRADGVVPHTPNIWLHFEQLQAKLLEDRQELVQQRTMVSNQVQKLRRLDTYLSDYKRLVMAIATSDVKWIRQLIQIALKQRVSIRAILARIESAVGNVYEARGYDGVDLDLARLVRHLGGPQLLYAMSKALGLPSSTTARRRSKTSIVRPCPAAPKPAEIAANIQSCFAGAIESAAREVGLDCGKPGQVLMIDGIAICQEATVAAIGPFSSENYHPIPVMVSATCKSENSTEFAGLLRMLIAQWKLHGEAACGPLWVISTDGDATFRGASYEVLMDRSFNMRGAIYWQLCHLEGLNLQCGLDDIIMGPDPKHLLKHECHSTAHPEDPQLIYCLQYSGAATLLRSKDGMMVNGVAIHRGHLARFLFLLPGQTKESVDTLIDPADHQNVPRAVKLLQSLAALRSLQLSDSTLSPTEQLLLHSLCVIAELWDSLLQPLINPDLSLSQQLRSLSKFAHMSFYLYRQHGSSFMSNQLYGDTQALVKAAFVCVARQKALDPSKKFHLYQLGSDRLEEVFGEVRTQTHDRNCDITQLSDRLSTSVDCVDIFNHHPEWNRGHRRISYSGREGVDHVNPTYFRGDLVVQNVFLDGSWRSGMHDATDALQGTGPGPKFMPLDPGFDFLRPFGGNSYPGVATDIDRSAIAADINEMESGVIDQSGTHSEGILDDTPSTEPSDDGAIPELDVELEDFLHESNEEGLVSTSQDKAKDWIECTLTNGTTKAIHKASILSALFQSGFGQLSIEQLLRVHCYTKDFRKPNLNNNEICGEKAILTSDIAICPVRTSDMFAIAFISIVAFERKGIRLYQIDEDELNSPETDVFVSGQVISMCDLYDTVQATRKWVWTGDYVRFQVAKSASGVPGINAPSEGSRKSHIVRVPGHLVQVLNVDILPTSFLPAKNRAVFDSKGVTSSWFVKHDWLTETMNVMFDAKGGEEYLSGPSKLAKYGESTAFPYKDGNGLDCLVLQNATRSLAEKNVESFGKVTCYQCGILVEPDQLRGHVGKHVLHALVGVKEAGLREGSEVDPHNACGFCGRPMSAACEVGLKKTVAKSYTVD
ncbi:hypothetical protein EVG20_g5104, partial [Dentipellis fragilis]